MNREEFLGYDLGQKVITELLSKTLEAVFACSHLQIRTRSWGSKMHFWINAGQEGQRVQSLLSVEVLLNTPLVLGNTYSSTFSSLQVKLK